MMLQCNRFLVAIKQDKQYSKIQNLGLLQLSPPTKESRPEIQDKTQELGRQDEDGLHVTKSLQQKRMVRPQHFAKLDRLVVSLSFCIFKGKNEVFFEGEIFQKKDETVINNTTRIYETFLNCFTRKTSCTKENCSKLKNVSKFKNWKEPQD